MNKQKRAIFTSAFAVGISILLLGYSAYGWLISTRTVSASGMNLSAIVPNNLQISLTNSSNENDWKEAVEIDIKEILAKEIANFDKNKKVAILPASSFNGFLGKIFQTERSKPDGTPHEGAIFNDGKEISLINSSYEGHYIDIPLYFRTASSADCSLFLDMADGKTDVISTNSSSNVSKVVRAAFLSFDKDKNSNGLNTPLVYAGEGNSTAKVIENKILPYPDNIITPQYIQKNPETGLSDKIVEVKGATNINGIISYNVTPICVRIWIEGQDTYCTHTIANESFKVNLFFKAN